MGDVTGTGPTIAAALRRAVAVAPDAEAAVSGGTRLSYADLDRRCRHLAGALLEAGLRPGDRVAVVGANSHQYLECYLAIPATGLVLVPLNTRSSERELRAALADAGTRWLFTDQPTPALAEAVERLVELGEDYERLLADAPAIPEWPGEVTEGDLAGLFYTGGTTGRAKGVMLPHRALVANAFHFMAYWPFSERTRWLVAAPMFHLAGTIGVLATVWRGGSHVFLPRFSAAGALDLAAAEGATHTLVVPTMLAAMADEQLRSPRRLTGLTHLAHGGSPCATEILRRARSAFPGATLLHVYGATETAPIATMFPEEERFLDLPRIRSCGQPAVGVDLRVVREDRTPTSPGEVGEVEVRGPNVTIGYWQQPEATASVLREGWYATGDLGRMDGESYLYLVDRAKDMIVTGGENVYSTEVEEVLFRHPRVAEAAVFGVPDDTWGEAVMAVVVPRAEPVTVEELLEHCRRELAGYKVPKRIELRAEPLPVSGAGKVLKRALREPYWEGRDVRIGGATLLSPPAPVPPSEPEPGAPA